MERPPSRSCKHLHPQRFQLLLWRLQDDEFQELRQRSFPIRVDGFITLRLRLADHGNPDALILPKALIVLEHLLGKSSVAIDSHKQTFAFPLVLKVVRDNGEFYYLLKIADYRSGIEFWLYRVVDQEKYFNVNIEFIQDPIDEELSKDDIEYLVQYLWGYLEGVASVLCKAPAEIPPFFRHIDASHVIYGFVDGEFFETEIDDYDEYHSMVAELEEKYSEPIIPPVQNLSETQAMLDKITG